MRRALGLLTALVLAISACASESVSPPTEGPGPSVVVPAPTVAATLAPPDPAATTPGPGDPITPTSTTPAGTVGGRPSTTAVVAANSTIAPTPSTLALADLVLRLELVAEGFIRPVLVIAPPGDLRLFVVDQPGRVFVIDGGDVQTFLDIRDIVRFGGEQGLLGFAFHPGFASSGLFYVDFIDDDGATVLSGFVVDESADIGLASASTPWSRLNAVR